MKRDIIPDNAPLPPELRGWWHALILGVTILVGISPLSLSLSLSLSLGNSYHQINTREQRPSVGNLFFLLRFYFHLKTVPVKHYIVTKNDIIYNFP